MNADAGIERGTTDDAAGARLWLQHLERRRDVFNPRGIRRPRLERVNQDDWQVAREVLCIRVHAQVNFGGDGSLKLRVGRTRHDGDHPEARRFVESDRPPVDGRHHGRQRAVDRVVDVGPGLNTEGDRFAADESSRTRAEENRQGICLGGLRGRQVRRACKQDENQRRLARLQSPRPTRALHD